jgi:hypothetical protein
VLYTTIHNQPTFNAPKRPDHPVCTTRRASDSHKVLGVAVEPVLRASHEPHTGRQQVVL